MQIDTKPLNELKPNITRRLKEAKTSCPVTVHQRIDNALTLIERQAAEIERLQNITQSEGHQ